MSDNPPPQAPSTTQSKHSSASIELKDPNKKTSLVSATQVLTSSSSIPQSDEVSSPDVLPTISSPSRFGMTDPTEQVDKGKSTAKVSDSNPAPTTVTPNISCKSVTDNLAQYIFAPGTGISDDEVRKIMRVQVSSKQMNLDKQLAAGKKVIKRLKETLAALMKGKNELVHRSIEAETFARNSWALALEAAQLLDEDCCLLNQKVKHQKVVHQFSSHPNEADNNYASVDGERTDFKEKNDYSSSSPFSSRNKEDNDGGSIISDLAQRIFTPGTEISDDAVREILRIRVSSKQMDLDHQVSAGEKIIKRLKDTLAALMEGKNKFVHRSIDAEKSARNGRTQALKMEHFLDEDGNDLKQKVKFIISKLAQDIFSPGTGISDDEVCKTMRVRVSSKQMDLDQQVTAGEKVIKRLKDTLTALMEGKNKFVEISIYVEKSARNGESETDNLTQDIFAPGKGISDGEVRKITREQISSKQMDLYQQVATGEQLIKRLKDTLAALMKGKNKLVLEIAQFLDEDRGDLKQKVISNSTNNTLSTRLLEEKISLLRQMGFTDRHEMLAGLWHVSQSSGNVSTMDIETHVNQAMLWIVSQREEADEACRMDQVRMASEIIFIEDEIDKNSPLHITETASTEMILGQDNGVSKPSELFPFSVILKSSKVRTLFRSLLANNNQGSDKLSIAIVSLLTLEKKTRQWFGSKIPYAFFHHILLQKIEGWHRDLPDTMADGRYDKLAGLILNEISDLEKALYILSEQERGDLGMMIPKIFLRAREKFSDGHPIHSNRGEEIIICDDDDLDLKH